MLIGIGLNVLAHQLFGLSGGGTFFLSFAVAFGALYAFGARDEHRWAIWPTVVLGAFAWLSIVTGIPWLKETYGAVLHVTWPIGLVAVGLWLMQRRSGRVNDVTPGA